MGVRVVLVSDAPLYRAGIALTLGGTGAINVLATAVCGKQALECVHRLGPDIVLLDMAMPRAFDVARELARYADKVRIVALAVAEIECQVIACAAVGVAGYVPRAGSVDDAVDVIEAVARGEARCSPRFVSALLRRIAALPAEHHDGDAQANGRIPGLTAREAQIFALLRQGLSNKGISRRLGIELATVKNHVHSVLSKLGLHRRAEAALLKQMPDQTAATTDGTGQQQREPVH